MDDWQQGYVRGKDAGFDKAIDILRAEKECGAGWMDGIIQPFLDQLIDRLVKTKERRGD